MGKQTTEATEPTVTITQAEYESLKADVEFLRRLEAAGVDNWEGYDFAREAD